MYNFIYFCSKFKALLTEKKLLAILINLYNQSESNIHEHILSAINALIEDNPVAIKQAMNMTEFNLKSILTNRLALINEDPAHLVNKFLLNF